MSLSKTKGTIATNFRRFRWVQSSPRITMSLFWWHIGSHIPYWKTQRANIMIYLLRTRNSTLRIWHEFEIIYRHFQPNYQYQLVISMYPQHPLQLQPTVTTAQSILYFFGHTTILSSTSPLRNNLQILSS